jgi:hypothetical protein
MAHAVAILNLASEFDAFLFAPIREDKNGTLLSVVSALARLDVDPWDEAAKLAEMPGEAATQRLSALLASLPTEPTSNPEHQTIAARLVALLPHRVAAADLPRKNVPPTEVRVQSPVSTYAIYYLIFMLFLLLSQWFIGSRQPSVQIGETSTPSSATAPTPPRSSAP